MNRPDIIRRAGVLLYGQQTWQTEIAHQLTCYKPSGALSSRRVREWISGERSVPDWALAAIPTLFAARRGELVGDDARAILRAVRKEVGN